MHYWKHEKIRIERFCETAFIDLCVIDYFSVYTASLLMKSPSCRTGEMQPLLFHHICSFLFALTLAKKKVIGTLPVRICSLHNQCSILILFR